jgi:hypothetical protein
MRDWAEIISVLEGGEGSGNFAPGHRGIPKHQGGSMAYPGARKHKTNGIDPVALKALLEIPLNSSESVAGQAWKAKYNNLRFTNIDMSCIMKLLDEYTNGYYDIVADCFHWGMGGTEVLPGGDAEREGYTKEVSKGYANEPVDDYYSKDTRAEQAAKFQQLINASPPQKQSIFRGATPHVSALDRYTKLVEGSTIDILAPSSYSRSIAVARGFAQGTIKGSRQISNDRVPTIIEILPGAKAFNVAGMTEWKQKEVLTNGRFRVVSVLVNGRKALDMVR